VIHFSNPGNLLGKVRLPENPVKIKYHPHCAFIVLKVSSQRLCMKTHSPTFYMLPILHMQLSQYTDERFHMVYSMDRHFTCLVICTPLKGSRDYLSQFTFYFSVVTNLSATLIDI